ncbi:MAG: nitronate monooxygenase [Proteobacteria bacterium]|nr:nitronate monooxygenase [Pseudomonadota bacterium]
MLADDELHIAQGGWQNRVLHRPVCDLLGCRLPLMLAGMGRVARAEMAAAAAQAGGFGFLGMARESIALIREEVAKTRAAGVTRFGVNLISSDADADADADAALRAAQVDACIELNVPVLGLLGIVMPSLIRRAVDAGILVVQQVCSANDARQAEAAGAAVLVVQGVEAGRCVRATQHPLFQRLPEVLASAHVPVLAVGAVIDAAEIATLLALGAQGVMLDSAVVDGAGEPLRRIAAEAAQMLRTAADEPPPIELASPVCYAREFELTRDDAIDRPMLVAELDELLKGARAGMRLSLDVEDEGDVQSRLAALRRDEVRWCGMLIVALHSLGAAPSTRTSAFHAEAAQIKDAGERLAALLQRRQGDATQRLHALLPRVLDERLSDGLAEMLRAYQRGLME